MRSSRYLCASLSAVFCGLRIRSLSAHLCIALLAGTLGACGRIGVKVYPAEVVDRPDAADDARAPEEEPTDAAPQALDAEERLDSATDAAPVAEAVMEAAVPDAAVVDATAPADTGTQPGADASVDAGLACPVPCQNPHGTTSCVRGACLAACAAGYDDCDGNAANGCETTLASDPVHCGMCGRACPANGGVAVCSAAVCGTACNLSGTYAVKLSVAGSWPQDTYIRSGSGTFQFWLRLVASHSGNTLTGTLSECGRFIPPFSARSVPETFSFAYPNAVFDAALPGSAVAISLASASPGASFTLAPTALQLGIDMALAPFSRDPVTAAWPTQASQIPIGNRIDMDGDGRPGVTAEYADSNDHPRTGGTLGDPRSDNPYVASRVSFSLSGSLETCTTSSGSASVRYLDTRIYGCSLDTGECSTGQADFLDQNCLNYTLGAATYRLVKIADAAACAAVRAALP